MPFAPQPRGLAPGPSTKRFGTGLGIPYALEIMKAHGGDLRAESEPGKGSKFYLVLPEVKPLILLADDEPGFRFSAGLALRIAGYRVSEAADGLDALDGLVRFKVEGIPVHLLVTDLRMPNLDGRGLYYLAGRQGRLDIFRTQLGTTAPPRPESTAVELNYPGTPLAAIDPWPPGTLLA